MHVFLRHFLRCGFVFGTLYSVQIAHAAISQAGPTATRSGTSFVVSYASNGTPIASASRSVSAGATSGEMLIRDMLTVSGPAGNLPVTVQRVTTAAEVAGSIARGFVKGLGVVGVGVLAYDLITGIRGRLNGSVAEVDSGSAPASTIVDKWCVTGILDSSGNYKHCASSAAAAAQKAYDYDYLARTQSNDQPICGYSNGVGVPAAQRLSLDDVHSSGEMYYYSRRVTCSGPTQYFTDQVYGYYNSKKIGTESVLSCPGGGQVGADGKCATGVYAPVTVTQLQNLIKSAVTTAVADQHLKSPAASAVETAPMTVTGPATQVGTATTTTTNANGQTTTQTTTPTYQYSYAGDTINYNTVNNTTTTVVNNSTGTGQSTSTETKPETKVPGLCDLFPAISACQKLDTPEDSSSIPPQPWTPSITPHVFSSSATCPAPITVSFPRVSFVMVWGPLCNLATTFLAPIVTVLSMFAAAKVFFSGFRV